jgi:thiamine phosphate synthase YjbQ (UPF0047 family)
VWHQRLIRLRPRAFHLITRDVAEALPELAELRVGLAHLHILHVRVTDAQRERVARRARRLRGLVRPRRARGRATYWTHTVEGPDDMPGHVKPSVLGPSLTLPIRDGRLALGT